MLFCPPSSSPVPLPVDDSRWGAATTHSSSASENDDDNDDDDDDDDPATPALRRVIEALAAANGGNPLEMLPLMPRPEERSLRDVMPWMYVDVKMKSPKKRLWKAWWNSSM